MCAEPSWVGTASMDVPTRGVLFVYDEAGRWPEVRWVNGTGTASMTKLPASIEDAEYVDVGKSRRVLKALVLRVEYEGTAGARIVVNSRDYTLVSDWRAPIDAPRVTSFAHHQDSWTCSSSDSLELDIDQPTAAFRARWTFDGSTKEWVIPAREARLSLGKLDCTGTTLPPDELENGGHLELHAIRLDGSEVRVAGLPTTLIAANMVQTGRTPEQSRREERERVDRRYPSSDDRLFELSDPEDDVAIVLGLLVLLVILPRCVVLFARHHDRV